MNSGRKFAAYAWTVLAYNLFVVVWGAFVRATGSGAGCGSHWPLCNGSVVPRSPALSTIIEFTHRATSGVALILVAVLVFWAFRAYPRGHRVRLGAALSGVFLMTEALIGAGLVLFEHVAKNASNARGFSLSIHLINTFTLVAVLALTGWWASGAPALSLRDPSKPRWLLCGTLGAMIALGISGAIAALGDTLFPASSLSAGVQQDLSASAHIFVRLRVFHPGIAIAVTALVLYVAMRGIKEWNVQRLGFAVMGLAFFQVMLGAVNLALLAPAWMQLIHLLVADLLWIAMVLFSAAVLGGGAEKQQARLVTYSAKLSSNSRLSC
jgi:heme A synthase